MWGFDRPEIGDGQVWRLLTAHFVHLNGTHLALNLLGLTGILLVWGQALGEARVLAAAFVGSACMASLGLWFMSPELVFYAGASGAVHGMFAAGCVLATRLGPIFRLVAALGLLLKLVTEVNFNTGTAELIGAPVIHASHQWGALGGVMIAGLIRVTQKRGPL
ncbi:MAG: rhombosortase [Pseudomonadota bacterium]